MTSRSSIELSELPNGQPTPSSSTSVSPHPEDAITSTGGVDDAPSSTEDQSTRNRRLSLSKGEEEASSLPPVDRGRGAWTYVAAATVLEMFIWGYGLCFSVILVHLEHHEPWSKASLSALSSIGTVQLGLMYFLTFFVNNAFRRYPDYAKLALYMSAGMYSGSLLLSSFATEVWHLIVLQGVIAACAGATLYAPCLLWTMDWFYAKRGTASGIIFAGTGLGGFAFPFLLGKLLDSYGFAWTVRIWSILCAVVLFSAVYFIRPRIPPTKPGKGQFRPKYFLVDFKALNHPVNWTVSITTLVASLAYFPIALYLPLYTSNMLSSSDSFTPNLVVAIFNLVSFLSSIGIGWASDRSLSGTATFLGVVGGAVSLGAWGTATSLAKIFVFAAIFGATTPISSYWGAASREIGGRNPFVSSTMLCFWGMIRGIASILAPYLSVGLYNEKESHSQSASWGRYGFRDMIIFVGVMSLLSSFGGIVLGALKMRSNAANRKGMGPA